MSGRWQVLGGVWSSSGGCGGLLTGYLVDIDEGSFGPTVGAGVDFEEDGDELERGQLRMSYISF